MQNTLKYGRQSTSKAPSRDFIPVSSFELTSPPQSSLIPHRGLATTLSGSAGWVEKPSCGDGGNKFNNSSISLTDCYKRPPIPEYELTREDFDLIKQYEEDTGFGVGFRLNQFSSGEVTGGCYSRAVRNKPPVPEKRIISTAWSRASKKKIRRAVECNRTDERLQFRTFLTLTFDSRLDHVVKNPDGTVCHLYAKSELERFLNTLKKTYDRAYEKSQLPKHYFAYIWVSEIQSKNTNNIHFHIIFTIPFIPYKYINRIWRNGGTDIQKVHDARHAASYMTKYMQKDSSPVLGHRYGMTQNLSKTIKPLRTDFYGRYARSVFLKALDNLRHKIKLNGGNVFQFDIGDSRKFDCGFFIPAPVRPRFLRDRNGRPFQTRGTSSEISKMLLKAVADIPCTFPDLPF